MSAFNFSNSVVYPQDRSYPLLLDDTVPPADSYPFYQPPTPMTVSAHSDAASISSHSSHSSHSSYPPYIPAFPSSTSPSASSSSSLYSIILKPPIEDPHEDDASMNESKETNQFVEEKIKEEDPGVTQDMLPLRSLRSSHPSSHLSTVVPLIPLHAIQITPTMATLAPSSYSSSSIQHSSIHNSSIDNSSVHNSVLPMEQLIAKFSLYVSRKITYKLFIDIPALHKTFVRLYVVYRDYGNLYRSRRATGAVHIDVSAQEQAQLFLLSKIFAHFAQMCASPKWSHFQNPFKNRCLWTSLCRR